MAHATLADLGIYYTGAGSNSDPALSIGGDISSARILPQSASALTTLTGVTINWGAGNITGGAGTLSYNSSTKKMTFTPYGGSVGTAIDASANITTWVQGSNNGGGLSVTIVAASLPSATISNSVTFTTTTEKWFKNLTADETDAGVTKYHCFAVKNLHATVKMKSVKLYRALDTVAQDVLSMFLDPLAVGDGSTTSPTPVANENTAPGSSTFVTPNTKDHTDALDVGTLLAGEVRFFWIKQDVPSGIEEETENNIFEIGAYVRG